MGAEKTEEGESYGAVEETLFLSCAPQTGKVNCSNAKSILTASNRYGPWVEKTILVYRKQVASLCIVNKLADYTMLTTVSVYINDGLQDSSLS